MANRSSTYAQLKTVQSGCCLMLALSFLLMPTGTALAIGKTKAAESKAWPKRDFLPPIAIINSRLEANQSSDDTSPDGAVNLTAVSSPVLHTTAKVTRLDNALIDPKEAGLVGMNDLRHKVEEADLEHLWSAIVEKNPVIRFSLEKLATPIDLQTKQSSRFLTRTLSTMISGATMAATMMPGGGAYRNMSSVATGNALQNMVSGRTRPTVGNLSATEQIQLAGLIDELKLKLIRTYQDYQGSLQSLAQSREVTARNSAMYSQAMVGKNNMAIMATSRAYFQALLNETDLRQKARLQRLCLERLAGKEAVNQLELGPQFNPDAAIAKSSPATSEPKASVSPNSLDIIAPSIGPEAPFIGPDGPPAPPSLMSTTPRSLESTKTVKKTTTKGGKQQASTPLDLPQAMMEIGPSPSPDTSTLPLPLHFPSNNLNLWQPVAQQHGSFPMPIPDKILDGKEKLD
jgi:hypothetical protein